VPSASLLAGTMNSLRQAIRAVTLQPLFASVVILTLGLGIGANAAIFSAANGLLLRDPPFRDPERLVRISSVRGDEAGGGIAIPEFDELRGLPVIATAAMYTDQGMYNASGFGTPEELPATITTHNLFAVLGVSPIVGSTFSDTFDRARNFGLVISHGLWTRRFGQDPAIVGKTMVLDGAPGYTIYGVMPPGFTFPTQADLFRSSGIASDPTYYQRRDVRGMIVVARLAPGVGLGEARSAIATLARRLEREFPATNAGLTFQVTPLRDMYAGTMRPYIWLLVAAVTLVLVVACANATSLLLSRALSRAREAAVRTALGATRWQVLREQLTETLVLATLGGLLGAGIAATGVRAITRMVPVQLPPWMQVTVDGTTAAFLAAVTLLTGLITGLAPALRANDADLHAILKEGAWGSSEGSRHRRLRSALVVAEVALALVLLAGASLLLRSVWHLQQVDLGFRPEQALTFRVELGWAAYGTLEKTTAFHRQVVGRLRELPGVQAVTFDSNLPMSGKPRDPIVVHLPGQSMEDDARNPYVHLHSVEPRYFETMGIGIRHGRAFDDRDGADGAQVVIVSRRLAERLWPRADALGRQLLTQNNTIKPVVYTVVGVAEPVLQHELDGDPGFDVYRPFTQTSTGGAYYVVRTAGAPDTIAAAATGLIGAIDPNQSFLDVQTYSARVSNRIWQRRVAGALFAGFAALALVLAAVGLYGVLSYIVGQQTREIGVRLALGATAGDVYRLIIGRGLALAGLGAVIGMVAALALARLTSSLLFGIHPFDLVTFLTVPAVLILIALCASYVPARRAVRVSPLVTLKSE
jgi:putative ABC transport system permease protein